MGKVNPKTAEQVQKEMEEKTSEATPTETTEAQVSKCCSDSCGCKKNDEGSIPEV